MSSRKRDKPLNSQITAPWAEPLAPEVPAAASLISIENIHLPPQQPRRYFDPHAMKELVSSVRQHGLLQPLLVRPLPSGGYELVAGERRFRAAREIGLAEVPAVVRELSHQEALQFTLIENLQREDLNPVEETEGILQLLSLRLDNSGEEVISLLYRLENESKGKVTRNVTGNEITEQLEKVFDSIGTMSWKSFVRNRLPLVKLPQEILEALREGKIAYTKASAIAKVKDEPARRELLEEAIAQDLSLSQIKERIQSLFPPSQTETDAASLPHRLKVAYQQIKKSKVWSDPKKRKQLEKLLTQLEALTKESEPVG